MFILLFSILIALMIVVFAVQNAAVVPVQFFIWSTDLPLVLVIFCSVFAGALLMFCLALWRQLKHKITKRPKAQDAGKKAQDQDPIDISGLRTPSPQPDQKDGAAAPDGGSPANNDRKESK